MTVARPGEHARDINRDRPEALVETEYEEDDDFGGDALGFDDPEELADEIEEDESANPEDEELKDIKGG